MVTREQCLCAFQGIPSCPLTICWLLSRLFWPLSRREIKRQILRKAANVLHGQQKIAEETASWLESCYISYDCFTSILTRIKLYFVVYVRTNLSFFFGGERIWNWPIRFNTFWPLLLPQRKSLRCSSLPFQHEESVASCCCLFGRFGYAAILNLVRNWMLPREV